MLGVDVHAFDPDGQPVIDTVGELVVRQPMPSMPVGFWGDKDGSRLREAYFEMYPGMWRHGDWIEITSRGTAIIRGRSDATINRGGVRMGTAEIYRAVAGIPEVLDALVIDLPLAGTDGWMVLFVVLAADAELSDELVAAIRRRVREDCSPRHVPDEVRRVSAVPRTLSGKVLEVPVKRMLTGTAPDRAASRDSLANPAALEYFVALADEYRKRPVPRRAEWAPPMTFLAVDSITMALAPAARYRLEPLGQSRLVKRSRLHRRLRQ
jgi:acetoacetyl-CoA synthetase